MRCLFDLQFKLNMFDLSHRPSEFLKLASLFQGLLIALACIIAWWVEVNPWEHLNFNIEGLVWGVILTLPLYAFFIFSNRMQTGPLYDIKRILIDRMGPLLDVCRMADWVYLGFLAGITEEVLFRGVLQPAIEGHWGWMNGLIFSNLLFGLAHAITPVYALLAGLIGVYLGLALDIGSERNLLIPVLIHSLYDILAFMAVVKSYRCLRGQSF